MPSRFNLARFSGLLEGPHGGPPRYALAVVFVAASTIGRHWLNDMLLPGQMIFSAYYPAVMVTALLCGLGPGILATILSAICADYFFLPPARVLMLAERGEIIGLLLFVAVGVAISSLASALARARGLETAALRESENRTRRLLEELTQGIFLKDRNSVYLSVNPIYCRLLGFPVDPARFVGKSDLDFYPKEVAEKFRADDRRVMDSGRSEEIEDAVQRPDGTRCTFQVVKSPFRNEKGDIIGLLGIFWDITDRREAQARLRESEQDLREAQRVARLGHWTLNTATGRVIWSDELFRMLGLEPAAEAPPYSTHQQLFTPESWQRLAPSVENTARTGEPYELELETVLPGGRRGWMLARGEAARDLDGRIVALRGVALDITERKRTESALRESERQFSTLADCVPQFVWMCTPDGLNIYFNQRWFDYTGLSRNESYGKGWITPFHPDDQPAAWSAWSRATTTGETYVVESRLRAADGTYRWFLMRGTPIRDDDGRIVRWFGTCTDIDDMRRAQDALAASEARYRRLIAENASGVICTDADGTVVDCNDAAARMLGFESATDLHGSSMPLLHADLEFRERLRTQLLERKALLSLEVCLTKKDGTPTWVLANLSLVEMPGGSRQETVATFTDITELRRAREEVRTLNDTLEQRVRERTAELQAIFDTVPIGLAIATDPGAVHIHGNRAIEQMLGALPGDELSRGAADCAPYRIVEDGRERRPEDLPMQRAARGETVPGELMEIRRGDGSVIVAHSVAAPLFDNEHRPRGAVGAFLDVTALKKAESDLRASEQRLAAVIESLTAGIWVVDAAGKVTVKNRAADIIWRGDAPLSGGPEEYNEYAAWDVESGKRLEADDYPLARTLRSGAPVDPVELRIRRFDGTDGFIVMSTAVLRSTDGALAGAVGINVDITARKKAEAALRENEGLLRALTDNSPDAIYVKDTGSRWLMANPAVLRIVGKTAEQALGKTDVELYADPAVGLAILEHDRCIMESGRATAFEEVADTPDGRRTFLSVKAPRRDAQGNIVGIVGISHDITERQAAEAALRASESRFRTLADSVPDLVWTSTADGRWDYVNSRYLEYTGVPAASRFDGDWAAQVHPDDRAAVVAAWQLAVERAAEFESDVRIRGPQGGYRYFKCRATPVRDAHGRVDKWFGAATDIDDLRKLHEDLAAVNRELESFNYAVAHDLRAPLRHISGFAGLLTEEAAPMLTDASLKYVQRIRQGVDDMGQLLQELLNLSQIRRHELHREACDLNALVRQTIAELNAEAAGRQIAWRVGSLPAVECDPILMKQVLWNLLSNALKFTRHRRSAVIDVDRTTTHGVTAVFVRDNGAGFDMRYANKLFGVFQRLHRKEEFEGTGVGLAIVQRIIHRHGGSVWAEAEPDRGATFYFSLEPCELERQMRPEAQTTAPG